MTEDEAKTKMCCGPPLIAAATLAMHPESIVDASEAGKCIGSACMAWRWMDAAKGYDSAAIRKEQGGFCGLAGAPA